jgi:hypothetical protein
VTLDEVERELRIIEERADVARGRLYRRIRDEKLYREAGKRSFAAYIESERCDFTRQHVYRLIKLVEFEKAISAVGGAHALIAYDALGRLPVDALPELRERWERVIEHTRELEDALRDEQTLRDEISDEVERGLSLR